MKQSKQKIKKQNKEKNNKKKIQATNKHNTATCQAHTIKRKLRTEDNEKH